MLRPRRLANKICSDKLHRRARVLGPSVDAVRVELLENRQLLAAGQLDFTFAGDGIRDVNFSPVDGGISGNLAVQRDGKILVGSRNELQRINTDGTGDTSFNFNAPEGYSFNTILPLANGKILLGGSRGDGLLVARLEPDGSFDNTFSGDGIAVTSFMTTGPRGTVTDLAVQADGKIVAVGSSIISNSGGLLELVVARFNPDGNLDLTFSGDGRVADTFLPGDDRANSVVVQADGKILVAGSGHNAGNSSSDGLLVRYNPDGRLDSTYSNDGWLNLNRSTFDSLVDLALQPDGKAVAAGFFEDGGAVRVNSNGTLDTSFSGDGFAIRPYDEEAGGMFVLGVEVQRDGKILLGGGSEIIPQESFGASFRVARLLNNGSLDPTFGDEGVSRIDTHYREIISDIALAPDEKIVFLGDEENAQLVLGRLHNDNTGGVADTQSPTMPTNLRATDVTPTSASLLWDASTDNVAVQNYQLILFQNFPDGSAAARDPILLPGNAVGYTFNDLDPDTSYTFTVEALDPSFNRSGPARMDFRTATLPSGQQPFGGAPFAPGATIQAEDFDRGGQGVAYNDRDTANRGTATNYRPGEGVDVYARSFGYSVGYAQAGEWLEYTISVPTAGAYDLSFRVANPAAGARVHFELDGADVSGAINVPNTGSWSNYQTVTKSGVTLSAGTHVLRLSLDAAASNGSVGDFDWVRFSGPVGTPTDTQAPTAPANLHVSLTFTETLYFEWDASSDNVGVTAYDIFRDGNFVEQVPAGQRESVFENLEPDTTYTIGVRARDAAGNLSPITSIQAKTAADASTQTPFKGSPFNPGQVIQVEDFDNGGEGLAYHDNDTQNRGPSTYRPGTGVDLYTGPHGINAGYVQPGEWTEYTVNVPETGDYNFSVRVAHVAPGAQITLHLYGQQQWNSGPINIPNTGSWNAYTTVSIPAANIPAGRYELRLNYRQAASNGSVGNYDWLRFDRAGTTLPAPLEIPEINGADAHSINIIFNETQVPPDSIWRVERQKNGTTEWVLARVLNPGEGSFLDEGLERGTSYTYRYRVERGGEVSQWVHFTAGTSPFLEADIGSPVPAGFTSNAQAGSLYIIGAGGADIHGSADQFHFGHLPITGDFDYRVSLDEMNQPGGSPEPIDPWAKFGIMARESLNANSRNVAIVQSFSNGPRFQVRSTTGGWTTTSGTGLTQNENVQLRLRRVGDTFIGYQRGSSDDAWVEIGRTTLDLPDTIHLGVAATSHNQGSIVRAFFTSFGPVSS